MAATAAEIWHKRLGHLNYDAIKVLHDGDMTTGFKVTGQMERCFCEGCVLGTQHREPLPLSNTRASEVLELIHTDLHELPVQSRAGARHWGSFIDDFSRYVWVYPLVRKSDTIRAFSAWKAKVELETRARVKIVRDDKRGEYESHDIRQL
jgi:hypothetical protein